MSVVCGSHIDVGGHTVVARLVRAAVAGLTIALPAAP
jgi:hypothetical protein